MRLTEASAIIDQVAHDYPGIIQAKIDHGRDSDPDHDAYCVTLTLKREQLTFRCRWPSQYPKALQAWQCFLLSEEKQQAMIAALGAAGDQDEDEDGEECELSEAS